MSDDQLNKHDSLPLHKMIESLRAQLQASMDLAEQNDARIRFDVKSVDFELKVVASETGGVNGSIGWSIFKFGANSEAKDEQVHTIRLTVEPKDSRRNGGSAQVSGQAAG